MLNRNIFQPLSLKAETSEHAQFTIPLLYIVFANILTWYHVKTYTEDTPRKMRSQDDVMNVVTWRFLELLTMDATT